MRAMQEYAASAASSAMRHASYLAISSQMLRLQGSRL
jgi:hypothetical protein